MTICTASDDFSELQIGNLKKPIQTENRFAKKQITAQRSKIPARIVVTEVQTFDSSKGQKRLSQLLPAAKGQQRSSTETASA